MDKRPIGVFDSGVGGLTVVREILKALPNEDVVYFGDTQRVPYGTRSFETVREYARQDIELLLTKGVKMIVAACGTVSSVLGSEIDHAGDRLYTGVVTPSAAGAVRATKNGNIGIIGTTATVKSGAFEAAIKSLMPSARVYSVACPMFVPLVENGYFRGDLSATRIIARDYLSQFDGRDIDTLIMGCTHFPFLKDIFRELLGEDVTLIDPGEETAKRTREILIDNGLESQNERGGRLQCIVSDRTESLYECTRMLFGDELSFEAEMQSAENRGE